MILTPNRNVWRVERAERAAILSDGMYFGALREALLEAQSTVFIVGWDLDGRTRLVGESGKADDGFPEGFADFLTALVSKRPRLKIYLLVWDHSLLYATEREAFPVFSMHWRMPKRLRYCLDDDLPVGAAHHQKIVVVDDAIAFSGGQDVAIRRWDTTEHRLDEPGRVDPAGAPYLPFHDVQVMVDGRAALALADLVRQRWRAGACERTPRIRRRGDPWPGSIAPDLTDIDVGIARTYPPFEEQKEIRECETLFFDSVDRAEHGIFIENQFLTAVRFAERLAKRLLERPELEAVIIAPKHAHSWLEEQTMHAGLGRFMEVFKNTGSSERVALLHPMVCEGARTADTMVHSKVMIVDDVFLRVGSANLNNRSFGLDTECDLAFEASTCEHRAAIRQVRDRMLGHFCGVGAEDVAACLSRTGSLIDTARSLAREGRSLEPIQLDDARLGPASTLETVADPERPIAPPAFLQSFVGERPPAQRLRRFAKVIAAGIALVVLILAWRLTALSGIADPDVVRERLTHVAGMPGASLIVLAAFIVGGLVAFPVLLLIAATAATFGPLLGFVLAAGGAFSSATVTYAVGAAVGRAALENVLGPRLNRVRRAIAQRGVIAVVAVRLVPIAPFTLINLVAGASKIPFADYLLGTIIGMAPGLVVMSALGYQIWEIITEPTAANILLFILAVLAWLAISIGAQALLLRWRRHGS